MLAPVWLGLVLSSPGEFVFQFPAGWPVLGGFGLRWYGLCMTLAVLTAFFLAKYLAEARRLEPQPGQASERMESLALWFVLAGFAGARLYYVLSHWDQYAANPWAGFAIWQGGIIIHGGMIGAAIAVFVVARLTGLNPWKYGDVIMPGIAFAQAIGRWGNFFNSEAYGAPLAADSSWPIKEFIPPAMRVVDPARGIDYSSFEFYHPIFLYELILNAILGILLLVMFKKFPKLKDGTWVWTYLIGYSLIRIPYELLRVSAVAYIGGTSIKVAYVASGVGVVVGVAMLVYMYRFRFDPDLDALSAWMATQLGSEATAAPNLVERTWKIQQKNRRADLMEKITLAMPNFPLSVSKVLTVAERERILRELFEQLEGKKPVIGSPSHPPQER